MSKNYGQTGFSPNVEIGKGGPRIKDSAGTVQLRNSADTAFADVEADQLALGDAVFTEAATTADDLVVGDGTKAVGISVAANATFAGQIGFYLTTASGTFRAGMHYQTAGGERLGFYSGAGVRAQLNTTAFYPGADGAQALGLTNGRWSDGFINTAYLAGADSGDGSPGATDLVIGDGLASYGMTIFSSANSIINMTDAIGAERGVIRYDHGSERFEWEANGSYFLNMNSAAVYPQTDGVVELGLTSNRWERLWAVDAYLGGALAGAGGAGANDVVIGDNTTLTNRGITIRTNANSVGRLNFADSDGGTQGGLSYVHSSNEFLVTALGATAFRFSNTVFNPQTTGTKSLGSTGLRFLDAYIDQLLAAGAVAADADAASDDIILGDGTGPTGLTIHAGAGNNGRISWNDGVNIRDGEISYSGTVFTIRANNVSRYNIDGNRIAPASGQSSLDLGIVTEPFDLLFANTGLFAGAVAADGAPSSDDLVIGDGTGSAGLTLFITAAGVARFSATDVSGVQRGELRYQDNLSRWSFAASGTDRYLLDSGEFVPVGARNLGSASAPWTNFHATTGYFAGADSGDGSTGNANLVIGDGVATVGMTFFGPAAGTGADGISWTEATGGAHRGAIRYDFTTERFFFRTSGNSRMVLDGARLSGASAGSLDLGSASLPWDVEWLNTLYLAGANAGDAPVVADNLVIGDGTADFGMSIFTDIAGTARIVFNDTLLGNEGFLAYDHDNLVMDFGVESSGRVNLTTTRFGPASSETIDLGDSGDPFNDAWMGILYLAGADAGDAPAGSDELVIGDGTAADFGLTIFTGLGNSGRVVFADTIGGAQGVFRYSHTAGSFFWSIESSEELVLSGTALGPAVDGGLDLGGSGARWEKGFTNLMHWGVDIIGDGGTTSVTNGLINVTAPTSKSTVTLPTAVAGMRMEIDVVDASSGVDIDPDTGDKINGGVAGAAKTLSTPGKYFLYAKDATDWRLHGPLALA